MSSKTPSVWVPVYINGVAVKMELDTGASISFVNDHTWRNQLPLKRSHVTLTAYSGHRLPVLGENMVTVKTNDQKKVLLLVVVKGKGPSLLGRNWLAEVVLDWQTLTNNFANQIEMGQSFRLNVSSSDVQPLLMAFNGFMPTIQLTIIRVMPVTNFITKFV